MASGCSPDPCTELCKDTTSALEECIGEWSLDWEDFDASDRGDFQKRCTTRWGEVRSNLVARELEDARDQCKDSRSALVRAIQSDDSCDLLRALYLD